MKVIAILSAALLIGADVPIHYWKPPARIAWKFGPAYNPEWFSSYVPTDTTWSQTITVDADGFVICSGSPEARAALEDRRRREYEGLQRRMMEIAP